MTNFSLNLTNKKNSGQSTTSLQSNSLWRQNPARSRKPTKCRILRVKIRFQKLFNCWCNCHRARFWPKLSENYNWAKNSLSKCLLTNLSWTREWRNLRNFTKCNKKKSPDKQTKTKCSPTRKRKLWSCMNRECAKLKVCSCKLWENSKAVVSIEVTLLSRGVVTQIRWQYPMFQILKFSWSSYKVWLLTLNRRIWTTSQIFSTNKALHHN